jgi:hypothetical protein
VVHFPGSVIVLEQHGVVQVLGKLLSQIAKSQQILLHGKSIEAIAGERSATLRSRSKAIIIMGQNEWCLDWRQKVEEGRAAKRRYEGEEVIIAGLAPIGWLARIDG